MKHHAALIGANLIAGLIAGPALAGGPAPVTDEPVIVAAAPAPVAAPSGAWDGAYAGAQLGYGDLGSNGAGLDGDGALGGIHAGYRWDFGTAVVGVEADYDLSDLDLGAGAGTLDSVARLKLVGGYDLGSTLLYATAGAALAEATVGGGTLTDTGWFLGAGVDYAVTDRWSIGGEVLGHRFDDFDGSGADLDVTTVKARVSFNF